MSIATQRPINILSIDGSSNGLPALYVLEEMFARLKYDLNSDEELCPGDYFDVIGGAGTGGLIALLLGRIKMTVTQTIKAYMKLAPLFSLPSAKDDSERARNSTTFEDAFRNILEAAKTAVDSSLLDVNSPKTLVFTLNTASMSANYPLRSYTSRASNALPCTILQAACACIASPNKFAAVAIGDDHRQVALVDATIGYANPTSELLREAKEAFKGEVNVATIASIGVEMKINPSISLNAHDMELLTRLNADCERVHEEMQTRLGENTVYRRFGPEHKLEAPYKDIFGHVSAYLRRSIVSAAVDAVIKSVQTRAAGPSLQDITSVKHVEITLKPRPSLVDNFVGREDILLSMRQTHFDVHPRDRTRPAITVLTGLGGSGKTQIALKFALKYEDRYPDAPVYFIDGSKEATLKTDLETVIRSQGSNYRSASYEDALIWLASKSKQWLLIVDNFDDPSVKLSSFIPRCLHGNIIITTRDATRKFLSLNSTHEVEGLSASDAVTFLLKTSGYKSTPTNQTHAEEIAHELGYLPLALAHAAAYISIHQCLLTFLPTYRQSRAQLLETSPDFVQGYSHSVAATIQMSLAQLSPTTRDLLHIFAHLDARSIAYAVIAKAAERSFRHVELTADDRLQTATIEQANILMKIFCPSREWVSAAFDEIISTCLQYSLLRVSTQNEERFYSMHVLVQSYLQAKPGSVQGHSFPGLVARLLGSAVIVSGYAYDHLAFYRRLLPHVRTISVENVIEPGDHYGLGIVLREMNGGTVAISHLERGMEQWRCSVGEGHKNTLCIMTVLGHCYEEVGREEKALEIRERALETSTRIWGDDDIHTLVHMQCLANSYSIMGRDQQALELREIALMIYKELFGNEHRDTLGAMCDLANSYSTIREEEEAIDLMEIVLTTRVELLGYEHRDTLSAMSHLASSYSAVGRDEEALDLRETVLEVHRRSPSDEDWVTLQAIADVAASYQKMGMAQEALPIQQSILEQFISSLGEECPHTSLAMYNLAVTYHMLGMAVDLVELLRTALPLHEKILGANHDHSKNLLELAAWATANAVHIEDSTRTDTEGMQASNGAPSTT